MGSPTNEELELLKTYSQDKNFVLETGWGKSTEYLSKAEGVNRIVSIDICPGQPRFNNVEYLQGWSITTEDIIKIGDPRFVDSRYHTLDRSVALNKTILGEPNNLIRKTIFRYGSPDFFFCDTGEFCGLAEWLIIKDEIPIDGIFACHDIYFPKSIKCFQIVQQIYQSDNWRVILQTKSKQGLCIARRVK